MKYFTHKEGIRLRDLIGPIHMRWGRDLFLGLGILVVAFPCAMAGSYLAQVLVYASPAKTPMAFLMQAHALPVWATVYSLTVWWVIQLATEEMTYNGYVLPRLEALTGRTWIAFSVVGFWWSVQHCMFPFIPDWRYVAYRSLMMAPDRPVLHVGLSAHPPAVATDSCALADGHRGGDHDRHPDWGCDDGRRPLEKSCVIENRDSDKWESCGWNT